MNKLIEDLAKAVHNLNANGVLERERDDLQRQVKDLEKEVAKLHAKHAELMVQVRYGNEALVATRDAHAGVKSELAAVNAKVAEALAGLRKLLAPAA